MRTVGYAIFAVIFLIGCQAQSGLRTTSDLARDLRHKQVSFGLDQDLEIPSGRARLFLQDGNVVGGRSYYRPHCALVVDSIDHTGFPITAQIFDVIRVQRSTVQIAALSDLRFAGLLTASSSYNNNADRYFDGYHFWLDSGTQPAVMRLSCYGIYARPSDLRPPTLDEINAALGSIGTIRVLDDDKR